MASPRYVPVALLAVLIMSAVALAQATGPSKGNQRNSKLKPPPIISEETSNKNRRTSDCHFGKKVYELEERWNPDLGSPFGVMYCIRCECIAVQKKRRIAGRTLCRNIKNECPKPNCDEPVLLPGRCCKVCLEDGAIGLGPLKEDVSRIGSDDDDKQAKDFAALLTKKTSSQPTAASGASQTKSGYPLADMATGRFTFQKRHLYFSLVLPVSVSAAAAATTGPEADAVGRPPRYLQFLSEDGNILEEQELATNDYYNATGKICGVWRKVPRVYKQLLREEKLWVALMEDKDGEAITGRVARYKALSTELLSAVLTPSAGGASCPGCGGTAAVSMASASNSIHVTVAVSGLSSKGADVETFVVRLETLETGTNPSRVIEELVTVQKPQEVNVVEVRTVLEAQEMRLLLRGHIVLSVHAKRAPDVRLKGPFGPRIACDLFDSLVTAADALAADGGAANGELTTPVAVTSSGTAAAAGLAWMYVGRTGALHYRIKLRGLQSKVTRVTIESNGSSKTNKKARVVEDVTDMLSSVDSWEAGGVSWINGTVTRMAAKDLELLYEGELYINVATEQWPTSEIRGKLVPRLAGESHLATENGPVLLNPVGNGTGTNRAALGWVHVDNECNFHYDVAVTSSLLGTNGRRDQAHSLTVLELVDIPRISIEHQAGNSPGSGGIMLMDGSEPTGSAGSASNYGEVPFMPNIRLLEEFSGYQVENSVADLNKLSLARMDAGVAYLKLTEAPVTGTGSPGAQFQGWLTNVHVPGSCLPIGMGGRSVGGNLGEQSVLGVQGYVFDRAQDDNNEIPMATTRCFYEGKLYDDGRQWTAEHDRCMMCSCQRGRVVCDPVVCPALSCAGPSSAIIHPPGDCCPMCENVTKSVTESSRRGCHFEGDQKFHPAGSRWHPYLPPFGFSKCAVCVCDPLTLKVECTKLTCPPLSCPESEAYRPDPMACCKQCPAAPATTTPSAAALSQMLANKELLGEEAQVRGEVDILSSGGCRFKGDVFENGEEWHPRIQPWGEMRCINCNCKDGKVKCKRKKCAKTRCNGGRPATSSGGAGNDDCCPSCPEDGTATPFAASSPTTSVVASSSATKNNGDADAKKKRQREGRGRAGAGPHNNGRTHRQNHQHPPPTA
ncbi:dorsal-ventral patterning protein Sog-like [Daphnia carinata]|uniref:dorsal-ventral patterning protein Sog-like n=1 Tax=Daphnia carinata TaxID=120202 RepID=UPI00257E1CD3|nr:dorsal-ventral patterning protein Sog-like [Daphnia carinata]